MENREGYVLVRKKDCVRNKANNTNKYVDKGDYCLSIALKYFNAGLYDIKQLRSAAGIQIKETGEIINLLGIAKTGKSAWLYLETPEQLKTF